MLIFTWIFKLWIKNWGKIYKFLSLYRSPSQNKDDFETFLENLELILITWLKKNPLMMVVLCNFNAKSKFCYTNDFFTSSFGFYHIINKPTHILNNSSSCTDLIFAQQNLHTELSNGIRCSFFSTCKLSSPVTICEV